MTEHTSSKLLPCPFCGSAPALCVLEDEPGSPASFWFNCSCGIETCERRTEEEAVFVWNRRALPTPATEGQPQPVAWRPIESAPKDGTHILARHVPIGIRFTNLTNPPTVVHWFNDPDEPGFYTSVNELAPEHPFPANEWMPLPGDASPPSSELREALPFCDAMTIAERGLETWRTKEHNAKWWQKIDGTPIPNDLLVNIAEAFCAALSGGKNG